MMGNKHEFAWRSATELAYLIRSREVSPVEVMKATLERIDEINPKLNAFVTMNEHALAEAKLAEEAVMKGEPLGLLHGVPVGIKDMTPTKGIRTTMGSRLLEHNVPDRDAVYVQRLKGAGAVVVGKTNTPEFGYKGTTDNLVFGTTRNPWLLDRTPGGSSGGSAAAVAAGLVPIAEGGDGGGSIRIPAAFCGIYGFKPSFGRIPSDILSGFAGTSPFLHFGTLSRTVADSALMYQIGAGEHMIDPFSLKNEQDVFAELENGVKGMKIAYTRDFGFIPVNPEVVAATDRAVELFRALGAEVEEVDLALDNPQANLFDSWNTQWIALLTNGFGDLPPEQMALLDPNVQAFIKQGLKMSAFQLTRANTARDMLWNKTKELFDKYDALISPTTCCTAFPTSILGPTEIEGVAVDPLYGWFLTYPFNLTGQPAASIPCGFDSEGLPIGLQIACQRFEDAKLLRISRAFELIAPWADKHPSFKETAQQREHK